MHFKYSREHDKNGRLTLIDLFSLKAIKYQKITLEQREE